MDIIQGVVKDILLLLIGALISGVGVFYFQKRIEVNNQRLLDQESTKFARNYQKRVEALELLYKEYVVFVNGFFELLKNEDNEDLQKEVASKFSNFRELRNTNAIYLSQGENAILFDVLSNSTFFMLCLVVFIDMPKEPLRQVVSAINQSIKEMKLDILPIKASNLNKELLRDELRQCVVKEGEKIIELYRLASEGKDD